MTSVPLGTFNGLYTEASPSDLPEGASPLTINCDYVIGSVDQRPGKSSIFTFGSFTSDKLPGFADSQSDGPGELAWTSPNNATLNSPPLYASVALNSIVAPVDGLTEFQRTAAASSSGTVISTPSVTPDTASAWAIFFTSMNYFDGFSNGPIPDPGWSVFESGGAGSLIFEQVVTGPIAGGATLALHAAVGAGISLFGLVGGSIPTMIQTAAQSGGSLFDQTVDLTLGSPVTNGSTLMAYVISRQGAGFSGMSVSDDLGNVWEQVGLTGTGSSYVCIWACTGSPPGANVVHVLVGVAGTYDCRVRELSGGLAGHGAIPVSEQLTAINFPFSVPVNAGTLGFEVSVIGHQTDLDPDSILTLSLIDPGPDSPTFEFQLPSGDGTESFGTPKETWGLALSPALFNNPNFGVRLKASSNGSTPVTFDVAGIRIRVFLTPVPPPSFNYLKTFEQKAGEILNLFLDSSGVMWQENAIDNPDVLDAVYTAIEPDTFGQSCTQSNREFIALSNLQNGTDVPYSYNGTNFDRLSQVGPGAAPTAISSSAGSAIISITQRPAVPLLTGPHDWTLISDSPYDIGDFGKPATPGNVMTLIFRSATTVPAYILPGSNIVIAGFPSINGNTVNNDPAGVTAPKFYTVTSIGQAIPGELSYDAITFIVPFTTFYNKPTTGGCTIEATTATMTTSVQIPNLEVGNQFQVSGTPGGAPPSGYDATWKVTATPNASQLQITSTSLLSNVATYSFNIITGTAPTVGQAITVSQTLNGNGIFNVQQAIISAASAGSFSVDIVAPDVSSTAEDGAGIVFGTIFEFDAFAIIGNSLGGNVVTAGIIGAGVRKACYSFLTRNGYMTQPSPIVTFDVPTGSSNIAIANLAVGPSNVIARVIHLTPGNGGNFYNIPKPVTIIDNGVSILNTSTWVLDNITTNVVLSFSDGVLLGGIAIDVEKNNLFETPELGSCVGFISYAARLFAIGEQNKVANLLNYSFDGGIGVIQSTAGAGGGAGVNSTYPLGWTVDLTDGQGGAVIASPIFGSAYKISNTTGATKAVWGMITQGAFQDEFEVPIIFASTTYSVRVTVAVPSGPTTGDLIIDLFSPSSGRSVGTFTLDLATVGITMAIFTDTLLTTTLAPVPEDLLLRVYATNLLDGVIITLDRLEVFPTEEPNLSTQIIGSYINNFEAFDRITGVIDASIQNPQPVKSCGTLYDSLNIVKTNSLLSTQDNGTTEPVGWSTRVVSNRVGTPSIYGVTSGTEWELLVHQSGLHIFNGGEPIPLSREINKLWKLINWRYGHTVWVQIDLVNQRILVGVPLKTHVIDAKGQRQDNPWLPAGIIPDDDNPVTPNVILELNYSQLNTAGELADRDAIRATNSTGRLLTSDFVRKWSIWTVRAPAAAFIKRADQTEPLFLGNSEHTGKIYELVDDLLEDDGVAIDQRYDTYGFVTPDQEQALNLGSVRKVYELLLLLIDGAGEVAIRVYPNSLDGPFARDLLPNLTLPSSNNGDTEIPVNETATRLFLQFRSNAVGSGFNLSHMVMVMRQDPWSPVRGRNN